MSTTNPEFKNPEFFFKVEVFDLDQNMQKILLKLSILTKKRDNLYSSNN